MVVQEKINQLINSKEEIRLEVGSITRRPGWITIDRLPRAELVWDLAQGIPFPDNTVSAIYSSHFLEHLTFRECQKFLDESIRVLVKGGVFSVCVPNARIYIEAYMNPETDFSSYLRYEPANDRTNSKLDYINYMAYMNGHHKYLYDEENLVNILTMKGFENATLRPFDPKLDMEARDYESIYAVARK